ncbi:GNAT family N-acetyltransferase [Thioalkalivibrio sp. ALM2T]|uniref:GNAT family N-acetyltransferase n=1 Tax=Thioalkalivibrio sp. ALM2T TaxID=1158184 RepID=UPI000366B823|nr:GNAT family N-acetyltransferase [Thioalkalivibrio sp. ALM2T]
MTEDPSSAQAELVEAEAYESMMQLAESAGIPGFRVVRSGTHVALIAPGLKKMLVFNRVLGLGVSGPATEGHIDELAALYAEHDLPWAIELSPYARPESVLQWLRDRRIRRGAASAVLMRASSDVPEGKSDLEIRPWRPEDEDAGAALAVDAFSVPQEARALLTELPRSPKWRQWLALDDGTVVATGLLYLGDGVAWAGWEATRPDYRGRGLHGALISACLRDASLHGCTSVITDTAVGTPDRPDPSYQNHLRKGFEVLHLRHTYLAVPGVVAPA